MTSLVTRCPACSTLFKVVPDQLRISEGWVRCGQCDEVFDAQAQMQPHIVVLPDTPPSPGDTVAQVAREVEHPSPADEKGMPTPVSTEIDASAVGVHVVPDPVVELPGVAMDDRVEELATDMVADAAGDALPVDSAVESGLVPVVDLMPLRESTGEAAPRFEQSPLVADIENAQIVQASFLRRASRAGSRKWQWLYLLLVPMLGLVLLLQIVVQQRDRIAATEPVLATALNVLCQAVGCQVQPLRQIESLVIESSSFIKVKADVYRLSFSLKNNALVPLALPSAELALTDLRDQSVLRRVLAPAEYGARAETLGPGEELAVVVPVAVKAAGSTSDKVTGYRLLVFYP